MTIKEHYDNHLAFFYSWMVGDFEKVSNEELKFFETNGTIPIQNKKAVDFGAGHGVHSVALAKLGFKVSAVDFNSQLLGELKKNKKELEIDVIEADISKFSETIQDVELCLCMGDTIAHFESKEKLQKFFENIFRSLLTKGKFIISFRDYSSPLEGANRFIPVKSDDNRILTCFLEYYDTYIHVNDILHEKVEGRWKQTVSYYKKIRLNKLMIEEILIRLGYKLIAESVKRGMIYMILEK
jgi:SAM-dependent methyltransferase